MTTDDQAGHGADIDTEALLAALPARLCDIVRLGAARAPHAPALREDGRHWTYAELAQAVDDTAALLRQLDVRGGDRVMVVAENSVAQIVLAFAAAAIDAWIVLVNGRLSAREVDQIGEHCGARRVFYCAGASPEAAAHGARHGARRAETPFGPWLIGELNTACAAEPVPASGARQVAALIYTTGTTGHPKGVMLSHRNLLFIAAVSSRLRGLNASDRAWGVLPVSHVYGLASVMLGTLYAGACLHLCPRFSPAALLQALEHDRLTILQGVPAMYARLLETLGASQAEPGEPLRTQLRFIYAGGSPLTPSLKAAAEQLFGLPLHNGYGLTETSPTVSQTRLDQPRGDTSVGMVIPGVQARIVGADGADLPAGEAGELWIRGPNVMLGYYREPALSAAVMRPDGWINTGDVARRDDDGALFIAGRTKELIIRSGFNVYPLEVETVLNAHPAVTQSAVVGRTLADGNEEVVAYVEIDARHRVPLPQLQQYVAAALAPYKCPAEIIEMAALPAAATGKILKGQLKQMAQAAVTTTQNQQGD